MVDAVYDHVTYNVKKLFEFTAVVEDRKESITGLTNIRNDWRSKFLVYLFTRRGYKKLELAINRDNKFSYYYPILTAFDTENDDEANLLWLDGLKEDGMLDYSDLVDAVFCCKSCKSSHVLFSEICHDCGSLNIEMTDFLHCFSCGNIAPEYEFFKGEQLVCGQCKSRLKHIGTDYDKPLESYKCNSCNAESLDSKVISSCVDCGQVSATDELIKVKMYDYDLTEKAMLYVRSNIDYAMTVFDKINYVSPAFFRVFLEWSSSMQVRNDEYAFTILKINISSEVDISSINDLAKNLKTVLRTTDILTRMSTSFIWIILPNTYKKGGKVVLNKLKEMCKVDISNSNDFNIDLYFSKDLDKITDAKLTMAELASRG